MFYEHPLFKREIRPQAKLDSAIVVLNPAESKRLIAKAIAVLPEVKAALQKGTLIIGWGTTTVFVAEEILGKAFTQKNDFIHGVVSEGELTINDETRVFPFVLQDGKPSEMHQKAALQGFKPGDVFIKGANAVDTRGDIGILVAADFGGAIYHAWFAVTGRGGCFICPVGLEKLIPSVRDAAQKCGIFRFKHSMGVPISFVTFSTAKVVTEIEAIKILTGADAHHVASGGIGGSEGAVTLVVEGETNILERSFELVKSVKGEPSFPPPKKYSVPPAASVNYDPTILSHAAQKHLADIASKVY